MNMIVVISSSTGGPDALKTIVSKLTGDLVAPVVIVQHMKEKVTTSLSKRLGELTDYPVLEIEDGMQLRNSHIYVCPGAFNARCEKQGGHFVFRLNKAPKSLVSPNADVFLDSLSKTEIQKILCVTLTGMGSDSLKGITLLKGMTDKKVVVYTQSKESCVVYGMPKNIDMAGLSDGIFDIDMMAKAIMKHAGSNGGI